MASLFFDFVNHFMTVVYESVECLQTHVYFVCSNNRLVLLYIFAVVRTATRRSPNRRAPLGEPLHAAVRTAMCRSAKRKPKEKD